MLISSSLFDISPHDRRWLGYELEAHEHRTLQAIAKISSLDDMTDEFLDQLVADSIVEPLTIHDDRREHAERNEVIPAQLIPYECLARRKGINQNMQVSRISIPFSGDRNLTKYTGQVYGGSTPTARVSGDNIEFDVILAADRQKVKQEIDETTKRIKECADNVNRLVHAFNAALPAKVRTAFDEKFAELTDQQSIFDDMGIPAAKPEPSTEGFIVAKPASKKKAKKEQGVTVIINHVHTHIEKAYTEKLIQINKNVGGDVNNAIQASE
jgi:hypothetical protein